MGTREKELVEVEPPVSAALRIGGCAMVCDVRKGETEFGYPLLCAMGFGIVRRSTGVVHDDDTFSPPTSIYWIIDERGKSIPVDSVMVRDWHAETAWRYRMNQEAYNMCGSVSLCVFSLPCGIYAFFRLPTPAGNEPWVPESVKYFTARENAVAWHNNEAYKLIEAQKRRTGRRSHART